MKLSENDAQLFYKLWLPLLDYINNKHHISKVLKNISKSKNMDTNEIIKIADYLWENTDIIDEYLKEKSDIPEDHQQILRSWKYRIRGRFILERHLKKGSVIISEENEVYLVQGIVSTWEEMLCFDPPVMMEATIIPFRDVLISDGLVRAYPVVFGPNMKRSLKDTYMSAKKAGRIHSSIDYENDR